MFADELAKMEVKFKEQLKTNDNLKLQLAAEEDRYKVSSSYRQFRVQTLSTALRPFSAGDALLLSKQVCLWTTTYTYCVFTAGYGWSSSGIEPLMLSLPLNTVALTVLFMSRPICETTFYCCLCQALETSEAWLGGVLSSCLANAVLGSGQADICLVSQRNSNRLFCFERYCT